MILEQYNDLVLLALKLRADSDENLTARGHLVLAVNRKDNAFACG